MIFKREMSKGKTTNKITIEEDIEIMPRMKETIMEMVTREEDMITTTEDMKTVEDKIITIEIEIMIEIYTAFVTIFLIKNN